LIRSAAEYATARGFRVLYGDTDSLFIDAAEDDPQQALQLAERLRQDIGQHITRAIRATYQCESFLELEFEKLYHRFFLPELRGGKGGSKKRYAGLLVNDAGQEQLQFVGLESKRRDWTDVSKRFQAGLLMRVFHDEPVVDFIRSFVADLYAGRYDTELVYRKAVRKALADYTKTTPPHVQAARKQRGASGRLVEYIVTRNGPEPFGEGTAALDYEHYVEHQLKPVADAILLFLNTDFDTVTLAKKQLSLF
jgi:DNA polymerase-2